MALVVNSQGVKDIKVHNKFAEMAKQILEEALSRTPSEPLHKSILFIETIRVLDYWTVFQTLLPKEKRLSGPDFELIRWGWNLAAEHIFTRVEMSGAFPLIESSNENRLFAINLLHKLGRSVLLYRASEMIRYGLLDVECNEGEFIVRRAANVAEHFLDILEFGRINEMKRILADRDKDYWKGWKLIDINDYSELPTEPGAFWSRTLKSPLEKFKVDNIDELMTPLIHPWDSGHGVMMGYGALPEVDRHFLSQATELVCEWREEAGIHPGATLGELSGSDLTSIIVVLTFLHTKHIRFALLAMKDHPEISIPQSLTIWEPFEELVESAAEISNLDKNTVRCALNAITMQPSEASNLHKFTTPFVPLLISLGNGLVLRPVSSLIRNPFLSTITLQEWRDPTIKDKISTRREDWMRDEIYALFQGTRYRRVEGNIKIRDRGRVVTDIDAAIFDITSGELALFQIKWQDYFTNDVRILRSKARNLTREMDEWAEKVVSWIEQRGKNELIKTLRLKLRKGMSISSIYLFGISRSAARMRGYGFTTGNKNLAIANWPQFLRARYELGPVNRVFHQLFDTLRLEMHETIIAKPLPVTINVSGTSILFENMWNTFTDEDEDE